MNAPLIRGMNMVCKNCGWSVRWPGPIGGCCPLCRQQQAFRDAPNFMLGIIVFIVVFTLAMLFG